jgi:hypothetical protein
MGDLSSVIRMLAPGVNRVIHGGKECFVGNGRLDRLGLIHCHLAVYPIITD